jgi:spore germination cell wall hydrolase CwlJ-like protein
MDNAPNIKSPDAHDIDVLARTIYGEGRGEGMAGQVAIVFTIIHRARIAAAFRAANKRMHPLYGDGSIAAACLVPWQFSCWNQSDPNRLAMRTVTLADPAFQTASYVAHAVLQRQVNDALPRATHYFNPAVVKAPAWETGVAAHDGKAAIPPARFEGSIGHHRFYSMPHEIIDLVAQVMP